jgi:DNA-binding NarL/FixJ family response regulator
MSPPLRALVADNAPTRYGVRMALDGLAEVCAEAPDRASAVAAAKTHRPDVCLIGRSLPGGGIKAVREISASVPGASIVVLADRQEINDLLAALRAGAIGYMPVGFEAAHLRRAIAAVRSEQAAIPRSMVRELVYEIRSFDSVVQGQLTLRERQVLTMVRRGDSTARIAQLLDISPVTVRRHISVLVRKAGVESRADLITTPTRPEAPVALAV